MEGIIKVKKKLKLLPEDCNIKLEDGKPIFHIMFVLANLTLSKDSKIIENEIDGIKQDMKDKKDVLNKFAPYILITAKDEYQLNFDEAEPLLDFNLRR